MQLMQSAKPQWAGALHHEAQPGRSGMHLGLSHVRHSAALHVCSSHHEAQDDGPAAAPTGVGGRIS